MKRKTKLMCLLLATVMLLMLTACGKNGTQAQMGGGHDSSPLTLDDTVKVVIMSHPSWPASGDSRAWEYIREGTGANVDVTDIPSSEFVTKISVMFAAPEMLPDLMTFDYKPSTDTYMQQGALVALDDYADVMPNYNAFVDSLSEEVYNSLIVPRKAVDGKVYYSPTYGREGMQSVRAWMYREDVFKKHGLSAPTTQTEFIEACRTLKELYPDSFPFCMRSGMQNIDIIGTSWKPYFERGVYYDFDNEKWCYGAQEDTMLEVITFLNRMLNEKLIPSDFLTINVNSWQELVATGRGFIFPEFQTRIDFFTPLGRANVSEDYTFKAIAPPVMNEKTGLSMVAKKNIDSYGYVVCNTNDEKRITNAMKFLDWFYSDEAMELLSWGKEGETYNVVDGQKVYITDENGSQPNTMYGFALPGTVARFDPEAVNSFESDLINETRSMVLEHTMPNANPTSWLGLNDEEKKITESTGVEINTYTQEMISKFILGTEPLSGFDAFAADLASMGIDELLKAYETAYNRVK